MIIIITGQNPMCIGAEDDAIAELRSVVAPLLKEDPSLQGWCSRLTLERYLRARNGNIRKAALMLKHTLEWRALYKPDEISWDCIAAEAQTGKQEITEFCDSDGCVLLVMRPRNENSKSDEGQLRFLVYTLELASALAERQANGKVTWLIDFGGYALRNAPSLKVASATLHILQSHFPERLGRAICYHAPMLFSLTWKALQPFIDPRTARKIVFVDRRAGDAALAGVLPPGTLAACGIGGPCKAFDAGAYAAACRALEASRGAPRSAAANGNAEAGRTGR